MKELALDVEPPQKSEPVSKSTPYGVLKFAVRRIAVLVAVSSLPVTVWAQSSVTLYGVLDAGLIYTNKSLNAATGQNGGKQFELIATRLRAGRTVIHVVADSAPDPRFQPVHAGLADVYFSTLHEQRRRLGRQGPADADAA